MVPPPGVSDSVRSPPWALAMALQVARPRPVPAPSPSRWSRASGSRTFARSSEAMPLQGFMLSRAGEHFPRSYRGDQFPGKGSMAIGVIGVKRLFDPGEIEFFQP